MAMDSVQVLMATAQGLGLELTAEAYQALATLPDSHAADMITRVSTKVARGSLNNPSNYICAAIKRGYTTNDTYSQLKAAGLAPAIGGGGSYNAPPPTNGLTEVSSEEGNAAFQLAMQQALISGVLLSQDAANALMSLPSQHAAAILEFVAVNKAELPDPSQHILATVAQTKAQISVAVTPVVPQVVPPANPHVPSLIPPDITPLELLMTQLNQENLWGDQQLDVGTLLALRCLPQNEAVEMVQQFSGKGRGKGGGIANINNYMQAAVAKIQKEQQGQQLSITNGASFSPY